MTLSDFEAAGAYTNAGYLDIYHEGAHKRLAQVSADGSVALTPAGEAFAASRVTPDEAAEVVAPKPAPRKPKAKPEAPAPDPVDPSLGDELGALAGSLAE